MVNYSFYPISGTASPPSDDGSSPKILLERPFVYFGQTYDNIYVNNNGHLTFNASYSSYSPQRFPLYGSIDLIAPFWTDLDNRQTGLVLYNQYTNGSVLQRATRDINSYFPNLNFSADWVFVATWYEVAYFGTAGTTTFQAVLISGGQKSFVLFNYGSIASATQNVQAGYDTINSFHHFTIPGSFSSSATGNNSTFSLSSNVNVTGRWAFQIDKGPEGCTFDGKLCSFSGKRVQLGEFFWSDSNCTQKCTCTTSGIHCISELCSFSEICILTNFQFLCFNVPVFPPVIGTLAPPVISTSTPPVIINSTLPGSLYPMDGTASSRSDDGSSPQIHLQKPFAYFGKTYNSIYVNHNGHLTFDAPFSSYSPQRFPLYGSIDIIAPFWTDLDNRQTGLVLYNQYTNSSVLQQATRDINSYFPNLNFSADWVFVATWYDVPYFEPAGTTTFQAVLISGGQKSFVLFNYGSIASATQNVQAGYDTINSLHHFTIPGSFSSSATGNNSTFSLGSNVNVTGRWAFQVDSGERGCQFIDKRVQLGDFFWSDSNCTQKCTCTTSGIHCISELCSFSQICVATNFQFLCFNVSVPPPVTSTVAPPMMTSLPPTVLIPNNVTHLSHFYPISGATTTRSLDGSSPEILLQRPFVYFGQTYNNIYVNHNGHLTFNSPYSSYMPQRFPLYGPIDLIAPFWTDVDIRQTGLVLYNQYTNSSVLQQATRDINSYFPNLNFSADWVFVATWYEVPYYPMTATKTTFQAVLISGGQKSFVLFNYGSLAPTVWNVQAGYDTINSLHHFTIPGSFSSSATGNNSTFSLGSNVNVTGRWAFQIDSGPDGCVFDGTRVQLGDFFWSDSNCTQKCTCTTSGIHCISELCSFSQICVPTNFQFLCFNVSVPPPVTSTVAPPMMTSLPPTVLIPNNVTHLSHFYPISGATTTRSLDGSSPEILLQRPFVYFGQTYNNIYVNHNGHLTFNSPYSSYMPQRFPLYGSIDLIAPFWTDVDIRQTGLVLYNQYTNSSVLQQATRDINSYFPNLNFSADWVFVATWYEVPYYPMTATKTTFQAVLISGGQKSFVLFNYGSLAPTVWNVQAGYDTINSFHHFTIPGSFSSSATGNNSTFSLGSNVNVTGRWAFQIDSGPDGCVFDGTRVQLGDVFWSDSNCTQKCTCTTSGIHCISELCSFSQICVPTNFHFFCFNVSVPPPVTTSLPPTVLIPNNVTHLSTPVTSTFAPPVITTLPPTVIINSTLPGSLYPIYGTASSRSDDGSSPQILLQKPFAYFGKTYNYIFVNHNGHLTFDASYSSYSPQRFPLYGSIDIIAPFWTDLDNRQTGLVLYNQYTNSSVLQQATRDINSYFPNLNFSADWVFVATWYEVAYFGTAGTKTTFQAVLISGGQKSFVLMNYGSIDSTTLSVQAGYDTINSFHHFTIPGSFSSSATGNNSTFSLSSNVNVTGRWAFQIDSGVRGCQFNGEPVQLGDSFWSDSSCAQKCTCTRAGLQCSNQPCSFSQVCMPASFQFSCQTVPRRTCTISGDPHYYTFDDKVFSFQGTCTYVLSEQCQNELPYFRVEGKNEHFGNTRVSWTGLVKVFVYNETIELVKRTTGKAKVNGNFVATPFSLLQDRIQVYQSGMSMIVSTNFGLMVAYDISYYLRISLPYTYQNATCGLCGNFNNEPGDDLRTRDGEVVSSDVVFANSWRASGDEDPGCDAQCEGLECAGCTAAQTALYSNNDHCGILQNSSGPFAACHQTLPPQNFVDSCVYDVCVGGGYQPILCQSLGVYASQCQQNGIQPQNWRRPGFCEIPCPANSHYESQATGCPPTCVNPNSTQNCPLPVQESCVCDTGYVLSAGECVPYAECGCSFEGFYYRSGQTVILDEDCGRRCSCTAGSMTCSPHGCGPHASCSVDDGERGCRPNGYATCWIRGPGSYQTFDGLTYQYPGACRLVIAKEMGLSGHPHFNVITEKVPNILQDFSNVLKVRVQETEVTINMDNNKVWVDGQLYKLPFTSGSNQIRIFHSNTHSIILRTSFGLTVQTVWPHFVRVTAPVVYSSSLGGLCGNYNDEPNDDFQTPNGTLVHSSQVFGDSWREGSLASHCVENTVLNPLNYSSTEFCGILSSPHGPFTPCWPVVDPSQQVDVCVDILHRSEDPESTLCEVLRDYALMCQQQGVSLGEWRNTTGCAATCPSNSHYELCGTSCPSTCPSLSFPFSCDSPCQDGCQCNDGFVLNGNQCVPPTSCGCYHEGRYWQSGQQFWDGEECQSFCSCNGVTGVVSCVPHSCGPDEACRVVDGEFGCHPNPHGTCSASGDPHYLTFDGKTYDFQGTCRYVLAEVCNSSSGLHQFSVEAKNEPLNGLPVSITAEVAVTVWGYKVWMFSNNRVEVDGITRNLPFVLNGTISVFASGYQTFVRTSFGLSVMYDGWSTVSISVPPDYRGNMCGLCGNFNDNPNDDFHTPDGAAVTTPDAFGAAWKVPGNYTCSDGCGSSCPRCTNDQAARVQCEVIQAADGPFSFCHEHVDPAPFVSDCVFDVCVGGNAGNDLLCRAIETYVSACQSANVRIYPWRQNTTCSINCPANSHYELCGTDCGRTCASSTDATCEHACSEGCFCDEGFVRSGTTCVPEGSCGCQYEGFYYSVGESFWKDGCSERCECFASDVVHCAAASCTAEQQCTIKGGQLGCYDGMSTVMSTVAPTVLGSLYPISGTASSRSDDGSSPQIQLQKPFAYFGKLYNHTYVNHNGHLTFDASYSAYVPQRFPLYGSIDIIAPFWTDLDNRQTGLVLYNQYTNGSVLQQATRDINSYFPNLNFSADWVFVATWYEVAYYPMTGTKTTFQAVLISGGQKSFVLMNYGSIALTTLSVQAGYDTINSFHHFTIPGSFSSSATGDNSTFSLGSNVNVTGRWAFQVDSGVRGCQFNGEPVQLGDSFWSDSSCAQKCTCTRAGLQCSNQPCSFSQVCMPASFQFSCQTVPRRTCTISGDPHYYTFDDKVFSFQGTCTYVLSEQCQNELPYFRVEGKNEHFGNTRVSWTGLVKVFVYNETIELVKRTTGKAKVNGNFVAAPFSLLQDRIQVYQSGMSMIVSTDFGLMVAYDISYYLRISLPYTYQNATCGLCGNFNNQPGDDLRTRDGEVVSSDVVFANSWRASGDEDPGCDAQCEGLGCAGCTAAQTALYSNNDHCGILQNSSGPFAACHQTLPPQNFVDSCVYDVCVGGGYQPILCQSLGVYASQCQQNGIQPQNWRRPGFCEIPCPANSHFESQATGCPPTCVNPNSTQNCPLPVQESCVCDTGYVLSAGECVPYAECGCSFEGFYYRSGQTVILDEDCGRRCSCTAGSMTCSPHGCGPHASCSVDDGERGCRPNGYATCWIRGPGSYQTFDGLTYQYPGACRLIIAKEMGLSGHPHFNVITEKVPNILQGFSNVLKVLVQETEVTINMDNNDKVWVDGQLYKLPFTSGSNQIRIFHSNTHSIILRTSFGLTVQTVWPHFVRVTAPVVYSSSLGGLCGNYNDEPNDDFQTPNGTLVHSSQVFGDSWREGSLASHCVENTVLNPLNYSSTEFCGILSSPHGPFTPCWPVVDPSQQVDVCVDILRRSEDPESTLCEVLRDYALMCQQQEVSLGEWRNTTGCAATCPSNSHYELCGTSCPSTCPSLSFPFSCDSPCQDGCQCNDGFVLNGNQCVPPTSCGCYHEGRYWQSGQQFWDGEECQSLCSCNGVTGVVSCVPHSCGPDEACRVVDGEFGCHPNPHGTCSASGDPHYLTFDGKTYDFQGTCRYVLAEVCNSSSGLHQFSVEAKNEPWNGLPVSITAEVAVSVWGYKVWMFSNNRVEVDGITRNLPFVLNGTISVFASGYQTFVRTSFGLSVMYDGWSTVSISVPPDYRGNMCGLCGNFNDNPNDDFHTPDGAAVTTPDAFGAAWKVPGNYTCSDGCGSSCPRCTNDQAARVQCEVIQAADGPFSFCHEHVDPAPFVSDCVFDVCVGGNAGNDLLCRAIETYVSACQSANVRIYPWRQNTTCSINCPANSHYELCGTDCGRTCASSTDATCEHACSEGCFCDEGFVRSGTTCVPEGSCGCQYDGFYYSVGESFWKDGCTERCECFTSDVVHCAAASCTAAQQCTIKDGQLGCYDGMSTCTVWGDPHYITFDGALAHFQGTCSYIITETGSHGNNHTQFEVVATNNHRGNNHVSFVSSVDIHFSKDAESVHVRIGPNRGVKVDGSDVSLPTTVGAIAQVSTQEGFVVFDADDLIVKFDGQSTLLVRMSQYYQNKVSGMCGNFNGDPSDDKVKPSGILAQNDTEFGHSWKSPTSQAGCGSTDEIKGDGHCRFSQEYSEVCSIITNTSGPFSACHLHSDPQLFFSSCVYDLCLYTPANGMLCSAVSAYEKTCTVLGLNIPEWRPALHCAQSDPCEQLNCTENEWCGEKHGVYGCFCDEHHHRPNNDSYDSSITCESSSGTMSVSRCQLFEAGFHSSALHLRDSSCNGILQDGRLVFHFDNNNHLCGTVLRSNGTHFIYENDIQSETAPPGTLISRQKKLKLCFSCAYPLSQAQSMDVGINPVESILKKKLPAGRGSYHIRMTSYMDPDFHFPFTSETDIEVDEKLYVEVQTEGVDQHQLATILDSCWATPVNTEDYPVRWDLITNECPNPEDGTVELIQSGISTVARFSFRMFTFTNFTSIFLHCNVHLCLLNGSDCTPQCYPNHRRFQRDLSHYDSQPISFGPVGMKKYDRKLKASRAPGQLTSVFTVVVTLLAAKTLIL
ncbi:IgGFc-binding protein [Oryzias latipes]|uniref:IgGFc-binding protein n=1 Tax=Oryzias latipes TaxID=8090 RepID=UPI000CE28547|nr:IgGFc-binding protein [Oryzias latipes]